ncbi:MAG: hypothetical protein KAT34_07005 [Candidatus Aminicenantes bacterium]|nr:hypothetical protein [Candidatus Aminicenantes bacterium]
MRTVNAKKTRNKLGETLDSLEKNKLLQKIKDLRASPVIKKKSIDVLRELRGYEKRT